MQLMKHADTVDNLVTHFGSWLEIVRFVIREIDKSLVSYDVSDQRSERCKGHTAG
jgi:hypothetical protein